MPRYSTRAEKADPTITHALDTRHDITLCARKQKLDLAPATDDDDMEPTCKQCRHRDPRACAGPNDGPRVLKHIFQF